MASNQIRVNIPPQNAAEIVCDYVIGGSITGELIDKYIPYDYNGASCIVLVFEKHYWRAGNRLTLTVVIDNLNGFTNVRSIGGGGGEGFLSFDWGASNSFSECAVKALKNYIVR